MFSRLTLINLALIAVLLGALVATHAHFDPVSPFGLNDLGRDQALPIMAQSQWGAADPRPLSPLVDHLLR